MNITFDKNKLGLGIFTPPDIAHILNVPQQKIRWYINEVWDNRFGRNQFNETYSWSEGNKKAVNFHVLIEFFVVLELRKMGYSTNKIFKARKSIAEELNIAYPFATANLLTNGKDILYRVDEHIINADGTRQFNFIKIIEQFCNKLEFDANKIASCFWPMGKNHHIIVDPNHQFGEPVIEGTNIRAEIISRMYQAGESMKTLSILYNLNEKQITDAIHFYENKKAA